MSNFIFPFAQFLLVLSSFNYIVILWPIKLIDFILFYNFSIEKMDAMFPISYENTIIKKKEKKKRKEKSFFFDDQNFNFTLLTPLTLSLRCAQNSS